MPNKGESTGSATCIQIASIAKTNSATPIPSNGLVLCEKVQKDKLQSSSMPGVSHHSTGTSHATTAAAVPESSMTMKIEQGRDDDESSSSRHSNKGARIRNKAPSPSSFVPQNSNSDCDLLPEALDLIQDECKGEARWNKLIEMLDEEPSLARRHVPVICQGENTDGYLIHYLLAKRKQRPIPVFVFDALVTAFPSGLAYKDPRGGRLPLHIAIISPFCSKACSASRVELVKYLAEAYPQALQMVDSEGNTPLHYAATLHGSDMIQLLIQASPEACAITNARDRYPLHLLCARCMDDDEVIHRDDVAACVNAYPEALEHIDRFGRTPLHLICTAQNVWRWDMLEVLIYKYPQALLTKDKTRKTPLDLARRHKNRKNTSAVREEHGVVLSSLAECTARERRKHSSSIAAALLSPTSWMLSTRQSLSPKKREEQHHQEQPKEVGHADLQDCYG